MKCTIVCVLLILLAVWAASQSDFSLLSGDVSVEVRARPFSLHIKSPDADIAIGSREETRFGFGKWVGVDLDIYEGYLDLSRFGTTVYWVHTTDVESSVVAGDGASATVVVKTLDYLLEERKVSVHVSIEDSRVDIAGTVLDKDGNVDEGINRFGFGWTSSDTNEGFFGLGERFNKLNQRGIKLDCFTEDGGFGFGTNLRLPGGMTATYIPIPFFVSNKGYASFSNTTYRTQYDLCHKHDDVVYVQYDDNRLLHSFFLGSPRSAMKAYTARSGRSLVPPAFEMGPWNQLSGEFNSSAVPAGKDKIVWAAQQYRKMDVPSSLNVNGVHFFPEGSQRGREEELKSQNLYLKSLGFLSTAYFNPFVATVYSDVYNEAAQEGYFVQWDKEHNGSLLFKFSYKGAGPDPFYVSEFDFTNPAARAYYQSFIQSSLDLSFNGFMLDYGEYTSENTVFSDGRKGREMHNAYPLIYQETVFDFFTSIAKNITPASDPDPRVAPNIVYYVRSGYAGTQRRVWASWTGDPSCDWSEGSGLPAQITGSLNVGASGVPFSGSDIGGFVWLLEAKTSPELWMRWAQVGCASGLMHDQTGGTGPSPKTHMFDTEEGVFVWRKYAKLRTQLFPYLYTAAFEAHDTGMPLMRQHVLNFPSDTVALSVKYQYMLGPSLLVAPVVEKGQRTQKVYLPGASDQTEWYSFNPGVTYDEADGRYRIAYSPPLQGGQWKTVDAPVDVLPTFVIAGSMIATLDPTVDTLAPIDGPKAEGYDVVTKEDVSHLLHLWAFPSSSDLSARVSTFDGFNAKMKMDGNCIAFSCADELNRTVYMQVALPMSVLSSVSKMEDSKGNSFEEVSSWKDVITSTSPSFSKDKSQGVLWLGMPSTGNVNVC